MGKFLFSILAALGLCSTSCAQTEEKQTPPQEFITMAKADSTAVLLDVRRPEEFAEGHIAGARNLNFLDTESFMRGISQLDRTHTYYIYCRSGGRSAKAAKQMRSKGLKVVDMKGGMLLWTELGMPVSKETETDNDKKGN